MKKIILALSFIGMGTLTAQAAEMDMTKVDTDANGLVSMEESTAAGLPWTEEQFKAADTDADGSLNAEEFAKASAG